MFLSIISLSFSYPEFSKQEENRGSPPNDSGKHDRIAWTVGIQSRVDKGQSSRQLCVDKRIGDGEKASSQAPSSSDLGGGGVHEGCKAIWEARRCSNFCESLQQQADILHSLLLWQKYTGLSASRTWALLICSQRNISSYIHNYSPSEDSTVCPGCPTGRLAGFLSASLLKMLYDLTFHVALPKTPLS